MRAHQRRGSKAERKGISSMNDYNRENHKKKVCRLVLAMVLVMLIIWYAAEASGVFNLTIWRPGT